ncbi:MAG: DUF1653 domain-containing protein [Clostridia bacterium]|nr:DUF1653 domain-containing protein [Clostridia bacterium]
MREIVINGVYRHFKGNYYIVKNLAIDAESDAEVVVYKALYDDGKMFVRNKDNFLSEVDHEKYPEASQKFRFQLQQAPKIHPFLK